MSPIRCRHEDLRPAAASTASLPSCIMGGMRSPAGTAADVNTPNFTEPTFGQRLLAPLIDTLVLLPAILLIAAFSSGQAGRALSYAVVAAYQVALVARRGQTVGKVAMGTRVLDVNSGSTPSWKQSVVRWLVVIAFGVASLVVPALDPIEVLYTIVVLAPIIRPPLHRGIHDRAAGTVVSSDRPVALRG